MPERRGPRRAARARSPGSSGRRGSNTRTRASRTSKIPPERKPGRDRIERLASCQWVRDRETLIIIPRHGKREKPRSARPSATPHAAGESPHDTRACRTCPGKSTAPGSTARPPTTGRSTNSRASTCRSWTISRPRRPTRRTASSSPGIMEARSSAGATPGASQCEPEQWYVRSGSELIADSTLSRLTGSARYLEPAWPRHAPTQHHTQRRKRMEGSDRRHQRITLSTKRTAGTIHRLPAVPLIGDPITKNDYFPRQISESPMMSESRMRVVPGVLRKTPGTTIQSLSSNNTNVPRCNQRRTVIYLKQ